MIAIGKLVIEIGIYVAVTGLCLLLIHKRSSAGVLIGFVIGFVLREYWADNNLVIYTAIWIVVMCVVTGKIEIDAFIDKIKRR